MPSLKDLRNRIASVKATRKITKAMQMVAAAKLRRAQEAAHRRAPLRASAWTRVLANLGTRVTNREGASPLLVGTGKDDVHLLVVMTAERGLCGGFNSNIAKLARADAQRLLRRRQDGQDHDASAARAPTTCAATSAATSSSASTSAASSSSASPTPTTSPHKVLALFEAGEFDVATLYFSEFKSVIAQKPTALQLIPAKLPRGTARSAKSAGGRGGLRIRAGARRTILELPAPPQHRRRRSSAGLLENAASEQGARMSAMDSATRNAGDMINKLTMQLQPPAPGQHHQGADRDHLRRRGALNTNTVLRRTRKRGNGKQRNRSQFAR